MYFLDHSEDPRHSLLRRKEINIGKVVKHLKRLPVVPLIGDMTYATLAVLRDSPSFHGKVSSPFSTHCPSLSSPDAQEAMEYTTLPPKAKLAAVYDLVSQLETARAEHNTFTAQFKLALARLTDKTKVARIAMTTTKVMD